VLDARIYRAAFLPLLLAVLVAAFSLADRPRPIGTTSRRTPSRARAPRTR
jgi:hypothetical protein